MNFGLGQTGCKRPNSAESQPIRFLFGTRRCLGCGRIPAATGAAAATNAMFVLSKKSEVSFRSTKVNP